MDTEGRIILDAPTRAAFSHVEALRRAGIIPPQVMRLSMRLGGVALTPAELLKAIRRE